MKLILNDRKLDGMEGRTWEGDFEFEARASKNAYKINTRIIRDSSWNGCKYRADMDISYFGVLSSSR